MALFHCIHTIVRLIVSIHLISRRCHTPGMATNSTAPYPQRRGRIRCQWNRQDAIQQAALVDLVVAQVQVVLVAVIESQIRNVQARTNRRNTGVRMSLMNLPGGSFRFLSLG